MSGKNDERLLDATIKSSLSSMPDETAPEGFSARVMRELQPKKASVWMRFKLWLFGPQSMTFTPIQVVPVMTCVVALIVLGIVQMKPPAMSEDTVRLSSVRFVLNDMNMNARTVSVIGSFNSWKAERSVMYYNNDEGTWILEATLPPGDHEYMFLVDGVKLVSDPQASMSRDDGFGNKNSILFVNGGHEQTL
ncbi:MAG: glycogen-binding domain-containing protein [Pseudodesulfovibrio sp.]